MHFGASMFFTDYSMTPAELAQALEARGFEFALGGRALAHPDCRGARPGAAAASCRSSTTT